MQVEQYSKLLDPVAEVKNKILSGEIPGQGQKYMFTFDVDSNKLAAILDLGSTTSLVTREWALNAKLKFFKSRLPISFWGVLGHSSEKRDIVILRLRKDEFEVIVPAYVINELPAGISMLIGTDQIGKQIGLHIPPDDNSDKWVILREHSRVGY